MGWGILDHVGTVALAGDVMVTHECDTDDDDDDAQRDADHRHCALPYRLSPDRVSSSGWADKSGSYVIRWKQPIQYSYIFILTRVQLSYFKPRGGVATPPPSGFWSSRPNFFVKFFMGIVSGSRNPKVIVGIFYLYHVTLKLKVIDLERDRVYLFMTFTFKVTECLHSIYLSIFELLDPKNIDIDTKITFLACF